MATEAARDRRRQDEWAEGDSTFRESDLLEYIRTKPFLRVLWFPTSVTGLGDEWYDSPTRR